MKPRMVSSQMLSQKIYFNKRTTSLSGPTNRPSIVWNAMEDMEESVLPEALFCFIRLFHVLHPTVRRFTLISTDN